ncbi:MAG: hypothetical protein JRH09_19245 [Deltaproteobacteria bacterium]|nr:hypothetical protein [Deltaproteobacteria bacterium]
MNGKKLYLTTEAQRGGRGRQRQTDNSPQRHRGHGEKIFFSLIGRRRSGKKDHPEGIVVLSNQYLLSEL